MNKKREIPVLLAIFFLLLCSACNTPKPTDTPKKVQAALEGTPDLAGGPESAWRLGDFNQITDLANNFPHLVYYTSPHPHYQKQIALTFDDGPDLKYTPQILDILKRHNIKATFFIVGKRARAHPEMVKRIAAEGHAIGNHTWNHPDMVKLSPEHLKSEINRTEQELASLLGYRPHIVRPPYGAATRQDVLILSQLGYRVIDWSVDTKDWSGTPTSQIVQHVRQEAREGGIILEHCAGGKGEDLSNTVTALPEIIDYLQAQGYSFVTIPQMVNLPPQ